MAKVQMPFVAKFEQSERIQMLEVRNRALALNRQRVLYDVWEKDYATRVYGWNVVDEYQPQPGDMLLENGDHACWIDIGEIPHKDQIPSIQNGYEMTPKSWGEDYAFMMDQNEAKIYPGETIVGEIHWAMYMVRECDWKRTGSDVYETGRIARDMGVGGRSTGHTCPDLKIGLDAGFGGLLERVRRSLALYNKLDNPRKVNYLQGLEAVCLSVIRFIERYAEIAWRMAAEADTSDEKARFEKIADCCAHVAIQPPRNYYEAVQWIQFAVLFDRAVGHGNGYGRLDLYLIDYYLRDKQAGVLTRREAREYLSEMYMKLRGHFFAVGGRDIEGKDATNEMSWVVLEAYDLIGDYNNLAVMWHPDMDEDFYDYACDVLARHGQSIPILANYDILYWSERRNGVPHEHAWTVALSGCQWYSIPGREYCDQDVNTYCAISPLQRAIKRGIVEKAEDFEALYAIFAEETLSSAVALRNFKRAQDEYLGDLWPEMYTTLLCHGAVERAVDVVAPRGVDYQFTSCNVLGIPNVADSLLAIKKLVYEEKQYTLSEVQTACDTDWAGNEIMRQRFLRQSKYGNNIPEADEMLARVATTISDQMGRMINHKGQEYRPSLFHFQGHTAPNCIGATPDGRHAADYLAHGINPTAGMNERGLIPAINSLLATDLRKFQGASIQMDLQPKFFDGKEEHWRYIRDISQAYFRQGGAQINLHILDFEKLRDAIDHPDKLEYQDLVVRVTGYCARFVSLSRAYQEEFVSRSNYTRM